MKVFEKKFGPGMYVSVMHTEDGVRVRVLSKRPSPDWIEKEEKVTSKSYVSDDEIKTRLLSLIRLNPGKGKTYYTQLPVKRGGVPSYHERKEKIIEGLIEEGVLVLKQLDKPVGRRTHAVYPAE